MKKANLTILILELCMCLVVCVDIIQTCNIKELNKELMACEQEIAKAEAIEERLEKVIIKHYQSVNNEEETELKTTIKYVIEITDTEREMLYYAVANEVGNNYLTDESRLLVASVVVNRVLSEDFPDTVIEVLSAEGQFTEAYRNYYSHKIEPSDNVKQCVEEVLQRGSITDATYYYAPKYTSWKTANWFENELEFVYECDNQRFFKEKGENK